MALVYPSGTPGGRAGEPAVDPDNRDSLIAWHVWNDPNGCYRDEDIDVEDPGHRWTLEDLRDLALNPDAFYARQERDERPCMSRDCDAPATCSSSGALGTWYFCGYHMAHGADLS